MTSIYNKNFLFLISNLNFTEGLPKTKSHTSITWVCSRILWNIYSFCEGFHNSLQYQWAWSTIECYKRFVPPHPSPIGCWMDR